MKAREIPAQLPHPALPGADWADCFETQVQVSDLSAEAAARRAFDHMPGWVEGLMAIRNMLVRPFGLKGDPDTAAA